MRGRAARVVDPQHVVGRARRRAGARRRSRSSSAPHAAARRIADCTTGSSARADGHQHVARRGRWPAARRPDRARRRSPPAAPACPRSPGGRTRRRRGGRAPATPARGTTSSRRRRSGGPGRAAARARSLALAGGRSPAAPAAPVSTMVLLGVSGSMPHARPGRYRSWLAVPFPPQGQGGRCARRAPASWPRVSSERRAILEAFAEASSDALFSPRPAGPHHHVEPQRRAHLRLPRGRDRRPAARRRCSPSTSGPRSPTCSTRSSAATRVDHFETEMRAQDGMPVPISLSVRPLRDESGSVVGAVSIAQDITEMRLAQATLAEVEARLREGEAQAHVGPLAVGRRHRRRAVERRAPPDPRRRPARLRRHVRRARRLRRTPTIGTGCGRRWTTPRQSGRPFEDEYRIVRPDGERAADLPAGRADPELGRRSSSACGASART